MNKYTEIIETCLELDHHFGLGAVLDKLDAAFNLFSIRDWDSRNENKFYALTEDREHKLSYIYLLSIVDQETADEMIELLKEPV